MSKHIDADELIKWIRETQHKTTKMKNIICKIETMPSIDIVHCRECKFAEIADKTDDQDGYTCQFHRGSIWFSGSFCSWGERRNDE